MYIVADLNAVSIVEVYRHIISKCSGGVADCEDDQDEYRCSWPESMWPAVFLLDERLYDAESVSFRCMFTAFALMLTGIQGATIYCFVFQSHKDLLHDWWFDGHPEDALGGTVFLLHAVVVFWIMSVLHRGAAGWTPLWWIPCCGRRAHGRAP